MKTFITFIIFALFQYSQAQEIYTVQGKIPSKNLGFTLSHEHIFSNFGAEPSKVGIYNEEALLKQVVPYLKKVKALGIATIFDCTTAYFGRNIKLLKKLADSTGVQIVTNTGFYAAANDKYIPDFAYHSSEEEIAEIWISEFEHGIENTSIKPGFIKLAFDRGATSEMDVKLFKAGIITHQKTGLTIAVHTMGNLEAAKVQMSLLEKNKVFIDAWIWVHAHQVKDVNELLKAAKKGAWISLDGVRENNISEYIEKIQLFKRNDLFHKLLVSHDGNSFPRGGKIRPYEAISTLLISKLKENGFSQEEIEQLFLENPQKAFEI